MPDYGTMIQKAYVAYFGRPADAVGYQYWLGGLNSNALTVEDMYMHFAASQEYLSNYAGMTDSQIVTAVYQNLFDRAPEADGLLYWSTQMSAGWITIDNVVIEILGGAQNSDAEVIANKVEASAAFTAALNTAAEINGYSGAEAAAEAKAWLADVTDDASLAAALAGLDAAIIDVITPDVPAPVNQTFILTTGQDDLTGGAGNDVFRSTQATLQLGDSVDGGAGQDKLTVSISGAGIALNGFAATSVETIEVKSLSTSASVIDLSDVDGLTTLVSRETDGAAMTFQDIQSVNNVDISIIDTKETHNFIYDVNAYTSGVDNVDLRLEEIRGAAINFGTVGGVLGKSGVEKITIDSQTLVSPDLGKNLVSDLNVGNSLDTVLINGNADLQVCAPLDPFITLVDATGLNARLSLDMSAEDINAGRVTFRGAQDDTYITFGSAANAKSITTYGGDDTIYAGEGNNTIVSGAGNDYIMAGAGNDTIDAGSGNDTVLAGEGNNTVSGGENDDVIYTGAGNDVVIGGAGNDSLADLGGNNAIDMGAGDDTVKIGTATQCGCVENGMGNNLIDLGTGNDTLWMDAKELEVADTITGNAGSDTIVLCNVTGRVDYGYVMASETQRTTSIETFDLRNEGIYLTLTDNLIESAQDKTITVVTELSTGTQTVDITNITAPIYDFTLEGSRYKDIVVADDMTVNSMSTMRFDDPAYTTKENSTQDTLIVTDAANISATDTLNITGLEMIVLGGNTVWNVDITDALIRQTTGTSTLYIKVDDEVPEGSKLYLNTVGVITDSDTDVVVLRNSNVTVYLNGDLISVDGAALDYDTDNDGKGYLYFDTPLVFTHNADSLVGTDGDDIFYADTPEDINLSDYANGKSHNAGDKLILGAGVYSTASIWQQLNFSELDNIEILEFSEDVSYGVRFADAYTLDKYEFNTYYLTPGGDTVTKALTNHNFYMKGGADVLTTDLGADNVYINGGLDNDVVNMVSDANDGAWIKIVDVERVNGDAGADRVDILDANTVPVYLDLGASNDTVNGSNNGDVITVYGDEGIDYVYGGNGADNIRAYDVESLSGGNGNDVINAREVMPEVAPFDTVNGDAGDDVITVDNYDKILGGTGSDTITVKATQNNGTLWQNPDTIWGDEFNPTVVGGDDTIDISGNIGEDVIVFGTEKGTNVHGATLFGNAAHPTGYDVSVTSGFDTIYGFTTYATSGTDDDILNVRHLLDNAGGLDIDTINFATTGNIFSAGTRNNVIIGFNAATDANGDVVLTDSNFYAPGSLVTNTVRLEDDGEAVLALTGDADGDNVDHLDLFYVCDTDLSLGQSWHIVKIGVVYFDGNGLTGLSGGSMENNFENSLVSL